MTESMTRKDGIELYDSKRIYELEASLARKEALLRGILNDPRVLPEWVGELIKRELKGE